MTRYSQPSGLRDRLVARIQPTIAKLVPSESCPNSCWPAMVSGTPERSIATANTRAPVSIRSVVTTARVATTSAAVSPPVGWAAGRAVVIAPA